jgi:diadenosine tetraphosphate (Ap4A) HIT family hydrolase
MENDLRPEADWSLHPQLENDAAPVGDLALCRVLGIDDATYPWLILVPRRADIVEIADLSRPDAARLMDEIALASRALKHMTGCDKLNIAAIGNVVPQLHVHAVARWKSDPLWPKPVWGHWAPNPGDAAGFARFLATVRRELGLLASL